MKMLASYSAEDASLCIESVNKSKANSLGVRRGLLVSARIHFLLGLRSSHVQLSENQFIILDNKYTKWQPATAIK